MRYTTLNEIWKHDPCGEAKGSGEGWDKLLTTLGKTKADDEPLSLLTILDSNGIDDCLWAARADTAEDADRFWRLLACEYADHVQPADADPRSLNAIAVARKYAVGEADADELAAASAAAQSAARAAASAAARAAVRAAASAAAWEAAAWAAERAWQEARLRELLSETDALGGRTALADS